MSEKLRRSVLYIAICLLSMSLFTACSGLHVSGGLIGTLLSLFGIVFFVLTLSTTQTACEVKPCLSVIQEQPKGDGGGGKDTPDSPDTRVGPCLTAPPPDVRPDNTQPDPPVGPCLSPPPPDVRPEPTPDDVKVEPCLSRPPPDTRSPEKPADTPDAGGRDTVGPCLSPPPPDEGTKEGAKDTVGPCLSPPAPDKMGMNDVGTSPQGKPSLPTRVASRANERKDAISRLQQKGILPPDVAARLQSKDPGKSNKKG